MDLKTYSSFSDQRQANASLVAPIASSPTIVFDHPIIGFDQQANQAREVRIEENNSTIEAEAEHLLDVNKKNTNQIIEEEVTTVPPKVPHAPQLANLLKIP